MQVLTPEEIQRLLIQAKEDNCFELLLLELSTGLRRGEICALQWGDLSFRAGELRVQRQVHRVKGRLVTSPPKSKAGNRSVILPTPVLNVLKAYKETISSRWMFPSPVSEDSPRDPTEVRKRLQTVLERAECKKIRFHDLRHPNVKPKTKILFTKQGFKAHYFLGPKLLLLDINEPLFIVFHREIQYPNFLNYHW